MNRFHFTAAFVAALGLGAIAPQTASAHGPKSRHHHIGHVSPILGLTLGNRFDLGHRHGLHHRHKHRRRSSIGLSVNFPVWGYGGLGYHGLGYSRFGSLHSRHLNDVYWRQRARAAEAELQRRQAAGQVAPQPVYVQPAPGVQPPIYNQPQAAAPVAPYELPNSKVAVGQPVQVAPPVYAAPQAAPQVYSAPQAAPQVYAPAQQVAPQQQAAPQIFTQPAPQAYAAPQQQVQQAPAAPSEYVDIGNYDVFAPSATTTQAPLEVVPADVYQAPSSGGAYYTN